jgi:SAM-dependent methyltransferase
VIWIGYTTLYRDGGPEFERVARTMSREKSGDVRCERIETKREFIDAMARLAAEGRQIRELHFVGHSGLYGPMFRTTSMPEQFSPHEWRTMSLPLASDCHAYFHCCRSARWFAPFFARTFKVHAHGYHLYTTFSRRHDRFAWERGGSSPHDPLYVVALPGKKSHGRLGSVMKYSGIARLEAMKTFLPDHEPDRSYDPVAHLYDAVFTDIAVRSDEVDWMKARLPVRPRVLDIGCGNGALLGHLSGDIASGTGVDASPAILDRARDRWKEKSNLSFVDIDGPRLPFPDGSFDVVTSLLSWRYLDWDPLMMEIRRVLAPGGRLMVVDMVALPMTAKDLPLFAKSKVRQWSTHASRREYATHLKRLVTDPRWKQMLDHNPIRADHEYRWYFESRFPGKKLETLTAGWTNRVVAFDTGPLEPGWTPPQSYP